MIETRLQRRLAAILAADVVGYSRLMGIDEIGTLVRLKALRRDTIDPKIAAHSGRIFKLMGDGMLVEFASVVDAVACAVEIQNEIRQLEPGTTDTNPLRLRIGINVGDIVIEADDVFGDGVNVAARIEGVATPGGVSLSEDAWRQVQGKLPVDFVDDGIHNLKNIERPLRVYRVDLGAEEAAPPVVALPFSPDLPSIAVLPFQNMSGDSEQSFFCDGLVEDIITTLSKLPRLRVIARNSSSIYKEGSVDIREAAKQLGVRHVLGGSVRKSGQRIRISVQLSDARDGTQLWAERYDRAVDDIFAIQDEITLVVATEMQVKFTEGEQARLRYTTTSNVEAWTLWVQGLSHFQAGPVKDKNAAARICWEKALALDPNSAALNAMLGFLHSIDARFDWWDDRETAIGKAHAYANRALELDPGNADAYITSGCAFLMRRQHEEAAGAARRAVALAPGSADVASLASFLLTQSGYPGEAVPHSERAMALSPHYPAHYLGLLGDAYRLSGRTEPAVAAFRARHSRTPGFGLPDLVITYHDAGSLEDAKLAAKELMAVRSDFTVNGWRKTQFIRCDTARVEADATALGAAGVPLD